MEKAISLAYRYLSFRPRTVFEVRSYLHKKGLKYGFTPDEIQAVIELLSDQGFLNDREFIKSFVSSRNSLKPKSRRVLEMELMRLGVSQADIGAFFSENETDEYTLATKALKSRLKSLIQIPEERKRFIRAISFLQRRGFPYDMAKKAYLQLLG